MEPPRDNKALDGDQRVKVNLKQKSTAQCAAYITGATPAPLALDNSSKRERFGGYNGWNNGFRYGRSLLTCYSNFKKSGVPQRLMYRLDDEWADFPTDLFDLVKKDLEEKKAATNVKVNGQHYLVDFLHMFLLNLETGLQQHIAWIDDAGKCFFPEIYANDDESYGSSQRVCVKPHEIKLQLEIDINGLDKSMLEADNGGSNAQANNVQIGETAANNRPVLGIQDSNNRQPAPAPRISHVLHANRAVANVSGNGTLGCDVVQRIFLEGMRSLGLLEILDIYRCSGVSLQTRFELFEKQIEITVASRGNANVRYAWLASAEREIPTIIRYGLGHCQPLAMKATFGVGVHLTSVGFPDTSSAYCEVDRNGVRHMILCRIVLGNMEVIQPGSNQALPSSKDFDTGVDDILNPRHYIVWSMNMNTHIFPEYVVTFKLLSNNQGYSIRRDAIRDVPTPCAQLASFLGVQNQMPIGPSATGRGISLGSGSLRAPNSPWLPFTVLFAAVAKVIPPRDMDLIHENYQLFKGKRMTRDDFIKLLRSTVGDALLKSTLMKLQAGEYFDIMLI